VPGIPVVLGISATVERFNRAMEGAKGRAILPGIEVDPTRVRDSGLLKDTIALDIPDEAGQFDTVLVRRATEKLRDSTIEWAAYTKEQDNGEAVIPLMVLQVPNAPNHNDIGRALDVVFQQWPDLPESCVAHVFGEHSMQTFGGYSVPYVSPERVQDQTWIRVLIAKDAISTGWDCPRAEVMVSFRRAIDRTHVTQMLGRMVRTPLARRIPGNDRLNSVDCLLPFFDEETVQDVVKALMQGGGDSPLFGRILINPKEMKANPAVTDDIWRKFSSLRSQTRPQQGAKPPIRLTALAHELAADDLLPDAGKKAHAAMHKVLDDFILARSDEFSQKKKAVTTVEGRTVLADLRDGRVHSAVFETGADYTVINDAYRRASRILSPDIARTYAELRARRNPVAEEDIEDALIEAREDIGALGLMENMAPIFDAEAKTLSDSWLAQYRQQIKALPDDRQDTYRQISALSREPQDIDLARPVSWMEATAVREKDGSEHKIPTFPNHLLCDANGMYPAELTTWEMAVLSIELRRDGFRFWYRNPDRPTQDSLGIAYRDGDDTKMLRPDFIFFAQLASGEVVADIVDPHGFHLADALPKLQGLARYAEAHSKDFRRIEAVAEIAGKLRSLDLTSSDVRSAIVIATSAKSLYEGTLARDYA
jgi:hypothetical protein